MNEHALRVQERAAVEEVEGGVGANEHRAALDAFAQNDRAL
jgi:hypothetical protein